MDRKIEKKTWTTKRVSMVVGGVFLVAMIVYVLAFMDVRSTLNVDRERITVSTVQEDVFQEFIQVTGTVQPIETIYLDAIEGGVVNQVFLESGTMVEEGDTILSMSNSNLQLQVMQQTSALYDQINNLRNSRLNLEQNTLQLQEQLANARAQLQILEAQYERQKHLREQDLISEQEFEETLANYNYEKERYKLTYESYRRDSLQSITQSRQLDDSEQRMYQNLEAVQQILENLTVTAPASGQLSTIELNQGQSISAGERIGQVDNLDDYKVRVNIDEFHLSRIVPGLQGSFTFDGETHDLRITKIYPVITNGQFEVDMEFSDEAPEGLRRGQTLRIRLELGESAQAVRLARGGFYQTTGGNWVFLLNEDETRAVRHDIRLGRQNPEYFEVLSGLEPGDKVITSSYDTFGDNEVLVLE